MANIFWWTAVYISVQEVKDTTNKAWIIALTDWEIQELIYKAQYRIDNYIGSYWTPYNEEQEFIFPVKNADWNSEIPKDVKIATFYVVEQIYENGDTIQWSTITWTWAITSERVWDRSISYDVWTATNTNWLVSQWIPNEALSILKKYKEVFFKTKL